LITLFKFKNGVPLMNAFPHHYQILNLPSMAKRFAADGNKQRLARTLRDMSNDPNRTVLVHDEAARLDVDVSELDLSPVAW
jgi:hypothetical protein